MREAEYKKKIIEYLRRNMEKGYDPDSLKWALVKQGYSRTLIDASIKEVKREPIRDPLAVREKPVITHEIIGENDQPVMENKPWWKRIFG